MLRGSLGALDTHVLPSAHPPFACCLPPSPRPPLAGLSHDGRAEGSGRGPAPSALCIEKEVDFKDGQKAFFLTANWVSLAALPPHACTHTRSHIFDFPTNKQSIISVTAQNVLFRLTGAKRDDPKLSHHKMRFQEQFDGTGTSPPRPGRKPPVARAPVSENSAPLSP